MVVLTSKKTFPMRIVAWLAVLVALFGNVIEASGRMVARENDVQAVILYNLAHFVQWPEQQLADPGAPFVIGLLGKDPFGSVINDILEGERVDGHPMAVERLGDVESAIGCQIVFIADSEEPSLERILEELGTRSILTVSAIPGFVDAGGDIEFVRENDRVRFRINLAAVRGTGLQVSSTLLASGIAIVVEGKDGESK